MLFVSDTSRWEARHMSHITTHAHTHAHTQTDGQTHTHTHTQTHTDRHTHIHKTHTLLICETVIRVLSNNYRVHTHYTCCMYVLLTSHPSNTVQHMPPRLCRSGMYQVRYCPRARSITHLLHARLGYQHFFHSFFVVAVLGVKVRPILCNVGPAERAISRNMDRSRMSGIGKLHDDGHVPCNNGMYKNVCYYNEPWNKHTLRHVHWGMTDYSGLWAYGRGPLLYVYWWWIDKSYTSIHLLSLMNHSVIVLVWMPWTNLLFSNLIMQSTHFVERYFYKFLISPFSNFFTNIFIT